MKSCKKIENYSALFEVAKASLYLPYYFDCYDEKIIQEEHQTKYYTMARSPKLKRKYRNVNSELKLTTRTLFILNTDDKFSLDRIHIRDNKFKIETNGYWKTLSPNEIERDDLAKKLDEICSTLNIYIYAFHAVGLLELVFFICLWNWFKFLFWLFLFCFFVCVCFMRLNIIYKTSFLLFFFFLSLLSFLLCL